MMDHADLINLAEPEQTCKNIQMCSDNDLMEGLKEEQHLDLSEHIKKVNSNPKSTWVAGINSKFDGASLREVKSLMGTIVDPEWRIN